MGTSMTVQPLRTMVRLTGTQKSTLQQSQWLPPPALKQQRFEQNGDFEPKWLRCVALRCVALNSNKIYAMEFIALLCIALWLRFFALHSVAFRLF